jgi:hypothetical protein
METLQTGSRPLVRRSTEKWPEGKRRDVAAIAPRLRFLPPNMLNAKPLPLLSSCSYIPNVLNKIRTLYHFLHRRLFIFIHLQSLFANTGVRGYARQNNQMTSLFIPLQEGKTPDRLGGGNPGLGGELRGLGPEELVKTFSGASSIDSATYSPAALSAPEGGQRHDNAAANFSESYSRRARRSAAALRK